jgi:copper chaperone CopZ
MTTTIKTLLAAFASASLAFGMAAAQDHHGDHGSHDEHHDHEGEAAKTEKVDAVEGRTVIVAVDGMVCDFCARSLTKVLTKNEAVDEVAISLEDKTVTILLTETGAMSDEEIEDAVKSAGYNLRDIERV